ncbi:MAG: DUF4347 domain-containing protein [Oceanicoccus sp.]
MSGNDDKTKQQNLKSQVRKVRYEPLEPRVLLSADFLPVELAPDNSASVDELIVDVDLDQVEETSRFIIEGLEPETDTASPDVAAQGADSEQIEAPATAAVIQTEETESTTQFQPLIQQYWLNKLSSSGLPSVIATDLVQEVIVVDSSIDDYRSLIGDLVANFGASHDVGVNDKPAQADDVTEADSSFVSDEILSFFDAEGNQTHSLRIVVLDQQSDGLDQISALLADYSDLSALHVVAHGAAGSMRLGNSAVSSDTISRRQQQLQDWGSAFADDGDILLYGCNVAEGSHGVEFVNKLAGITQTDIAASDDITGIDGDWQLEKSSGDINVNILSATAYQANLLALTNQPTIIEVFQNGAINIVSVNGSASDDSYEKIDLTGVVTLGNGDDTITFKKDSEVNLTNFNTGAGDDIIYVNGSTAIDGNLDGGDNTSVGDTLSYQNYTNSVQVDLAAGNASGFTSASTISNIENVTGGIKADVLVGDSANNRLDGGVGNDELTGGAGGDALIGGIGNDTYFYADGDWGIDTIVDAGGEEDRLDLADVSSDITFTFRSDNGNTVMDVATEMGQATAGNLPDDTGSLLSLAINSAAPTMNADGTVNLPAELNFAIALGAQTDADISSVTNDFNGDRTAFELFIQQRQLELAALYAAEQVSSTADYKVRFINGQLSIENINGDKFEIWQGVVADGPGVKTAMPNWALISGLEIPIDSSVETVFTVVKGEGLEQVTTTVTASLVAAYDSSTDTEKKTAWIKAIENALNTAPQAPVDNAAISARIEAEINVQLRLMWIDSIESSIAQAATVAVDELTVSVSADDTELNIVYVEAAGGSNAIWANPANAVLPGTDVLSNNINNIDNIEVIIGSSSDNTFTFSAIPDHNLQLEPAGDGSIVLNFSALSDSLKVSIEENGFISVEFSNGNTLTAKNVTNLIAGSGSDTFTFFPDASISGLDVGEGDNVVVYADSISDDLTIDLRGDVVTLPFVSSAINNAEFIKEVVVANGSDTVWANDTGMLLSGTDGGDTLTGGDERDDIYGGSGNDVIDGGLDGDLIDGGADNDKIDGGDGADTIIGGAGDDELFGGADDDDLDGGNDDDILIGGAGWDVLNGGAGDDTLIADTGGAGSDTSLRIVDTFDGGGGNDTYQFQDNWGKVIVIEDAAGGAGLDVIDFSLITADMLHIMSDNNILSGTGITEADITARQDAIGPAASDGSVPGIADYDFTDSMYSQSIERFETITAGSGDNTFLFGSDWGLKTTSISDYVTAWQNRGQVIAVDSSEVVSSGSNLVLDFRAVDQELIFTFKQDGSLEISRVEDIEWIKRFLGDGIAEIGADLADYFQEKEKTELGFEITFNKLVISDIDENTVIYGGRNHNVFELEEGTTFDGTVVGGTGFKPLKDDIFELLAANSTGLTLPEATDLSALTVVNELDLSNFGGDARVRLNGNIGLDLTRWSNIDDIKIDPSGINVVIGSDLTGFNVNPDKNNNTITIDGGVDIIRKLLEPVLTNEDKTIVEVVADDPAGVADGTFTVAAQVYAEYVIDVQTDNGISTLTLIGNLENEFNDNDVLAFSVATAGVTVANVDYVAVSNKTTITLNQDISDDVNDTHFLRKLLTVTILAVNDEDTGRIQQIEFDGDEKDTFKSDSRFALVQGANDESFDVQQAVMPHEYDDFNLGLNLLIGGTGGDTYVFEGGLWGAAAILEYPDVQVGGDGGVGIPEYFDTLDFSGLDLNLRYDVYNVTTGNINVLRTIADRLSGSGAESGIPEIEIGSNVILVSPQAALFTDLGLEIDFSDFFTGFPDDLPTSIPLLIANDIENLVGSGGDNEVVFHGDAYFQGSVIGENLTFNYSNFDHAADGKSGIEVLMGDSYWAGRPEASAYFASDEVNVSDWQGFDIDPIPDVTLPIIGTIEGWSASYGYAEGVDGERLGGLTDYFDFLASQLGITGQLADTWAQLAITGFAEINGSAGNDVLVGNGDEQKFELGAGVSTGGMDIVDGGGDSPQAGGSDTDGYEASFFDDNGIVPKEVFDIVSYEDAAHQIIIDLSAGAVFSTAGGFRPFDLLSVNGLGLGDYSAATTTQIALLADIEGAIGAKDQADLIIGTSGNDKFFITKDAVGDVIISNGGTDILDFSEITLLDGGAEVVTDINEINSIIASNADLLLSTDTTDLKIIRFQGDNDKVVLAYGNFDVEKLSGGAQAIKILKNIPFIGRVASIIDPSSATAVNAGVQTGANIDNAFLAGQPFADLVTAAKDNWRQIVGDSLVEEYLGDALLSFSHSDITDPADTVLAIATGSLADGFTINLDSNAAGYGWHAASDDSVAADQFDLLTVLMHEMGHILGVDHDVVPMTDLMAETLSTGQRLLPAVGVYDVADQQLLMDGLNAFEGWVGGLGDRALELLSFGDDKIPFLSLDFAELLGIPSDLGADISATVGSAINQQLAAIFGGDITTGDLINIDAISAAEGYTGDKVFSVHLDLLDSNQLRQTLELDLSAIDFGGNGIDFGSLPITIDGSASLEALVELGLDFIFGLDENGQFFIDNPTLQSNVRLLGENINPSISLFDVVGAEINGGLIDISTGLELAYNDRLSMSDLTDGNVDISALNPGFGNANYYDIDIPISLTGAFADLSDGVRISANSSGLGAVKLADGGGLSPVALLGSIPFMLQLEGFDDLKNFRNLSLSDLFQGFLETMDSWLDTGNADSPLYKKIPGINQSINDLLDQSPDSDGFFNRIRSAIAAIQVAADSFNNLGQAQDTVNAAIETIVDDAFGLINYDHPDYFTFTYEDSQLLTQFDINAMFSDYVDLDLNLFDYLSDLGLGDLEEFLGDSLSLTADTQLLATAFAELHLGLGADLSGLSQPITELNQDSFDPRDFFYVESNSGLRLGAGVVTSELLDAEFSISLPSDLGSLPFANLLEDLELGIWVDDGFLSADINGFVTLEQKEDGSNYSIDELITLGSTIIDYDISANALAELPLYFPTETLPLGGSTRDDNFDGVNDNVLRLLADYKLGEGFSYDITQVDLSNMFNLYAMLESPQFIKDALSGMFDTIGSTMTNSLGDVALPFVGQAFDAVGGFTDDLKGFLFGTNIPAIDISLGDFLDSAIRDGLSTSKALENLAFDGAGGMLDILEQSIEQAFGLADEDVVTEMTDDGFTFDFLIDGDVFEPKSLPLDFGLAMPGLNLNTGDQTGIELLMDYRMGIGFGFSGNDGFFLNTAGAEVSGNEVELNLIAQLTDGTALDVTLALLSGTMQEIDDDADGNSRLQGQVSVDLVDGGGDGRWTILGGESESLSVIANLSAYANVDLLLDVGIAVGGEDVFPGVNTVFHYDQVFADVTIGSGGSSTSLLESPEIVFEDVTIDFGTFISEIIDPIISEIEPIIAPINDVLALFRQEIDLGITQISLLSLAVEIEANLPASPYKVALGRAIGVIEFVETFVDFATMISDAAAEDGTIMVNAGTFTIGGDVVGQNSDQGGGDGSSWSGSGVAHDTSSQENLSGKTAAGSQGELLTTINDSSSGDDRKGGFSLPLLSDPSSAMGYLLGKNVDLFLYTLPDLGLDFQWGASTPMFPGLNARFFGDIGISTQLSFGLDTRGISDFIASSQELDDVDLLLNGFYLSDHFVFENGVAVEDTAEVTAWANISAGASLGIGGLVEAGIEGGIDTLITLNLHDLDADGKLYIDEFVDLIETPECLFDIKGMMSVYLEGFLWTGLKVFGEEITVYEARERFADATFTLFDYSCEMDSHAVSSLNNGTLSLFGDSELRSDYDGKDVISLEYKENYDPDGDPIPGSAAGSQFTTGNWIRANVNGYVDWISVDQTNNPISRLRIAGTSENDVISVGESFTEWANINGVDIFIDTGAGDDNISIYGGTGVDNGVERVVIGGSGNDFIIGSDYDDVLIGGSGDDVILAADGNDIVYGDAGNQTLINADTGSAGEDMLRGLEGEDRLYGGGAADYLIGGLDDDFIRGQGGADMIDWYEVDGSDDVDGGSGEDTLKQQSYVRSVDGTVEDDGTNQTVVLSSINGGELNWNGDITSLSSLEKVIIDTGAGADQITIGDLSDTQVSEVAVIAGSQRGTSTESRPVQKYNEETESWDFVMEVLVDDRGSAETTDDLWRILDEIPDGATTRIAYEDFTITGKAHDDDRDVIVINGGANNDTYNITTPEVETGDPDTGALAYEMIIAQGRVGETDARVNISIKELDSHKDAILLDAGDGDDVIDLSGITPVQQTPLHTQNPNGEILQELYILGGSDNDTLTGSLFGDFLFGGSGADIISGGRGEDVFTLTSVPDDIASKLEQSYSVADIANIDIAREATGEVDINGQPVYVQDTLIEQWDGNFLLNDDRLVTTLSATIGFFDNEPGSAGNPANASEYEDEDLANLFERVELRGLDTAAGARNEFIVFDYTFDALLDGAYNADNYVISLTGNPLRNATIEVADSGTNPFSDEVFLLGNNQGDAYRFDVDVDEQLQEMGYVERYADKSIIEDMFTGLDVDALAENIDSDATTGLSSNVRNLEDAVGPDLISQKLYYESAELLKVEARGGDDIFIVDDSTLELNIYGEEGNDQFFVGRVKATEQYINELGREFTLVTDITDGVRVTSYFYGGVGDDYFEVNHNVAEIFLYGEDGDDVFYLKAHLERKNGAESELASKDVSLSAGNADGEVNENDNDALFSYVKNNKVHILGGGGFDSLVIGGTDGDDEFYIFTEVVDGREVQRLYGAGLVVEEIDSIERFVILTGAGDDTVYVYGTLEGQQLMINTGSSYDPNKGDRVVFGGDAKNFEIDLPASADTQKYIGNIYIDGPEMLTNNPSVAGFRRLAWSEIESDLAVKQALWTELQQRFFTPYGILAYIPNLLTETVYNQLIAVLDEEYLAVDGPAANPWSVSYDWSRQVAQANDPVIAGLSQYYFYHYHQAIVQAEDFVNEMMGLFYTPTQSVPQYDISTTVQQIDGTKLNFQANLPDRVLPGYLPENYDLSKIQGEVQVIGASPNVTLEINHSATTEEHANGILTTVDVESAPLIINSAQLDSVATIASGNIDKALLIQDLQDTLRRMHRITDNGVVDVMLDDGHRDEATAVSLFPGQNIQEFTQESGDVETLLASYLDTYGYGDRLINTVSAPVSFNVYEKLLSGAPTPEGFTTTEYYGTEANYQLGLLDRVGFRLSPVGNDTYTAPTDSELNALLEDNDLLFDHFFTHSTEATTDIGRGLYEVFLYGFGDPDQYLVRLIDVPALERLRDAETDLTKVEELQELIANVSVFDYRLAPGWTADTFDSDSVETYLMERYGLGTSSLDPVKRSISEEVYRSSQTGAVEEIRVVRTLQTDTNGFVVYDNEENPITDKIRVYANNTLVVDVPNTFVTSKGDPGLITSTTFDTVQGFGTSNGIFYRNVTALELNLDTDPQLAGDSVLVNNEVLVQRFNQLNTVQINTGLGDDIVRLGDDVVDDRGTIDTDDDLWLYDSLASIDVNLQLTAGLGADKLYLSTENNTSGQNLIVTNNHIDGFGMEDGVDYIGFELLRHTLGEGKDIISVISTHADTLTLIDSKGGDDEIVITNANNSVNDVLGELRIDMGGGLADTLLMNDTGDLGPDTIVVDDYVLSDPDRGSEELFIGVTGIAAGNIFYRDDDGFLATDGLVLQAGSGSNRIEVRNIHGSDHTEIYAGVGDDTVTVFDFDRTGRDPSLTIYGESGSDFINAEASPVAVTVFGNLPGQNVADGLSDEDVIYGSVFDDAIQANGGRDIVIANEGNDVVDGGDGNDILIGDRGEVITSIPNAAGGVGQWQSVRSMGGSIGGDDILDAGEGNNVQFGGAGDDQLQAGGGNDIQAGDNAELILVNGEAQTLTTIDQAVGGNDELIGGAGSDIQSGGAGEDDLYGGKGNDYQLGDVGIARIENGVVRSLETKPFFIGGVDYISGGDGEDVILGGADSDVIDGFFIDDAIIGYYGRVLFEDTGDVSSVVIMGVDSQDLVGSALGGLYLAPVSPNEAESIKAVRVLSSSATSSFSTLSSTYTSRISPLDSSGAVNEEETSATGSVQPPVVDQKLPALPEDTGSPLDLLNPEAVDQIDGADSGVPAANQQEGTQEKAVEQPAADLQALDNNTRDSESDTSAVTTKNISGEAAAVIGMAAWKVHSANGGGSVNREHLDELDEKARKRRFMRWDGKRVISHNKIDD